LPLIRSRLAAVQLTADQLDHIQRNLQHARRLLPPVVTYAWVKALCNAWTTSHRMGVQVGTCVFCHAAGCDSMLHGLRCGVESGVVHALLPGLVDPGLPTPALACLFGGCQLSDMQAAGWAIALACIHAAMMAHRFGGAPGDGQQLARAKLRTLRLGHPKSEHVISYFSP
jgi:hypothetical protein